MNIGMAIAIEIFSTMISVIAFLMLSQVLHDEDSDKYYWKYFIMRILLLIALDFVAPNSVALIDMLSLFILVAILPSRHAKKVQENNKDYFEQLKANQSLEIDNNDTSIQDESNANSSTLFNYEYGIPDLSKYYPDYEEEKNASSVELSQITSNSTNRGFDYFLELYIDSKLGDKNALHKKNVGQIRIARIIFSLITFLVITYICLYHEYYFACAIIEIVAFAIYLNCKKRMNLVNYLKKQLVARPDDNMDYIIESIRQNSVSSKVLPSIIYIPATLIICCILFMNPHFIYERNATGYSLRYYTLAINNNSKVEIPNEYKGELVTEIRGKTFYNMSFIEEVKLPEFITEIRGNTFENTGLKSIVIPEGVTRIGGHAFYGCSNLSEVSIPYSLQEIGSSAFRRCNSLHHIRIPGHTSINSKAFKESPTKVERYTIDGE